MKCLAPDSREVSHIFNGIPDDDELCGTTITHTLRGEQHNLIVGDKSSNWQPIWSAIVIGRVSAEVGSSGRFSFVYLGATFDDDEDVVVIK